MNDAMPTQPAQPRALSLAQALGFSEQDLDANHGGRLSEAQMNRLRRLQRRSLIGIAAGMVFNGLAAAVFIYLGASSESPVLTVIGMGLTVVNAMIVGVGGATFMRAQHDLRAGEVAALEGKLIHTIRVNRRKRTYMIDIAGERLVIPREVFTAFDEGSAYRLYRSPATRILLSAEKLQGN
ncbi:MAG: hypothetical protein L6Q98_04975 [Anaerolineae bacterium]|nr:hypothetical protein [Anaerolineae bacterium]NUQ05225.1 hypothetical protein [Anaerolineae bacterium]